jgi:hypothetical protein
LAVPDWRGKFDRLTKFHNAVLQFIQRSRTNEDQLNEADKLLKIIGNELRKLQEFNTPVTVGLMKEVLGKSDYTRETSEWEIERRIQELKRAIEPKKPLAERLGRQFAKLWRKFE